MVTKIEQTGKEAVEQAGRDYIAKVGDHAPIDVMAGLTKLVTAYILVLGLIGYDKSDIVNTFTKILTKAVDNANNPS